MLCTCFGRGDFSLRCGSSSKLCIPSKCAAVSSFVVLSFGTLKEILPVYRHRSSPIAEFKRDAYGQWRTWCFLRMCDVCAATILGGECRRHEIRSASFAVIPSWPSIRLPCHDCTSHTKCSDYVSSCINVLVGFEVDAVMSSISEAPVVDPRNKTLSGTM